jgi:hypothetical protein
MTQIAVINESTAITDADVQKCSRHSEPMEPGPQFRLGSRHGRHQLCAQGQHPANGTWWLVFLDDSDQASALAYHDLTNEGRRMRYARRRARNNEVLMLRVTRPANSLSAIRRSSRSTSARSGRAVMSE